MSDAVTIERIGEGHLAVVKARTTMQDFPSVWRPLLDEVWAFLATVPGLHSGGHNVMVYSGGGGDELAVEVGVQVARPFEGSGRVVLSALPAGRAATTVHTGPPAGIGAAHAAVRAWCAAHGHALTGTSWEVYGDPDPATGAFPVTVQWQLAPTPETARVG